MRNWLQNKSFNEFDKPCILLLTDILTEPWTSLLALLENRKISMIHRDACAEHVIVLPNYC